MTAPFAVYVAAASAEIDRAERVIARLAECGVGVTFDWCAHMRSDADAPLTDAGARKAAEGDIDGVRRADAVLLLEPGCPTRRVGGEYVTDPVWTTGAWVEVGVALACVKALIVARPTPTPATTAAERCIFLALATVYADDDAAIRAVVRMAVLR